MTQKHIFRTFWMLLGLVASGSLHAQGSLVPSGCAQPTGPVLPWQDCPGAMWITQSETVVQTLNVRGPGCISGELPASSCLITNERRTVWLMFEVQPLPGGPEAYGSPAGNLAFSIIPSDIDGQTLTDDGENLLGMTDYDFALFDVTALPTRADACAAIRSATATGTQGSIQVACNYSGLPGPTGMGTLGLAFSADDRRYNRELSVTVGQVFLLAVDNYSLNATYFRLKFGTDAGLAQIVPTETAGTGSTLIETGKACGYGIDVQYSAPIALDSLRTDAFLLTHNGRSQRPTAIYASTPDELRGQTNRLTLLFSEKLDSGTIELAQTARLADRYGREQIAFTHIQQVYSPARISTENTRLCESERFSSVAHLTDGCTFLGWTASPGFGPGVGNARGFGLLPGTQVAPGTYRLSYRFAWPEGCIDSTSIWIKVIDTPLAPILQAAPGNRLETVLEANTTAEWILADSLFEGPAHIQAQTQGLYRVRQSREGCRSPWSNAIGVSLTAVKRLAGVETSVYPNPAHGSLSITVKGADGSPLEVDLINAEGRTVLHHNYRTADWQFRVGLDGFKPGIYTIVLSTETVTTSHRVIVQ